MRTTCNIANRIGFGNILDFERLIKNGDDNLVINVEKDELCSSSEGDEGIMIFITTNRLLRDDEEPMLIEMNKEEAYFLAKSILAMCKTLKITEL